MKQLKLVEPVFPGKLVLTSDEYHAHPAIGSTSLKHVLRSPAHYKSNKENPPEPTPAMALGTAIHEALLEPNVFMANSIVMPRFEGKGMRDRKDQWMLEHHGKRIVTADQMATIMGALKAISAHKTARSLLSSGAAEESYFWRDPDTGLDCKCRPDFVRDGHILVDVKTTNDASFDCFSKTIANFQYHLQAAFYLAGVGHVIGQKFDQFVIVAVEKEAPHGVAVYQLDDGTIDAGRFLYQKALEKLARARDTGAYPAYPDQILSMALPAWAWPYEGGE